MRKDSAGRESMLHAHAELPTTRYEYMTTPWTIDTSMVYCFDSRRGENRSIDIVGIVECGRHLSIHIVGDNIL